MTYKLIKTDNYLLVVGNSEIKVGNYFYSVRELIEKAIINYPKNEHEGIVIAHLPLNGAPILEDVDLLPPIEEDVEQLAEYYWRMTYIMALDESTKPYIIQDYKSGYNKAREKYKYTEEDVIRIVNKSRITGLTAEYLMLASQYPTEFECDTITINKLCTHESDCPYEECEIAKTTTNAQGQRVWVGKYK